MEVYEQIGDTDADMLNNCADVLDGISKEEMHKKLKEAEEIFGRMQEQDKIIHNLRTELGLD